MLRTCQLHEKLPSATWVVTVGSAVFKGPLEPQPASLSGCGRMVIVAGTGDAGNFDPADPLLHALQRKGADVASVRFEGGHVVPDEPLRRVLGQLLDE